MASTVGSRSSAVTAAIPISPVGPVLPSRTALKPRCHESLIADRFVAAEKTKKR